MDRDGEPPSLVLEFSDTQGHLAVDAEALRALGRRLLLSEGVHSAFISVALVDNAAIHRLNVAHLGHDWPTDVISFVLSEPGADVLSGELIVSAEMAAETARAGGFDARAELALYMVHGLLHLCGYDDQTSPGAAAMRAREAEILAREGLTNTFSLAVTEEDREAEGVRRECARWPV